MEIMNNEPSVKEINEVIKNIEEALKPGCEIGARDNVTLANLLRANNIKKKAKFFKCKRDQSDKIILHFVKEKGVTKNKFSGNSQPSIYILF
jgi:hypothetical protein